MDEAKAASTAWWVAVLSLPGSMRRRRVTRYATTQTEARKKLTDLHREFDEEQSISTANSSLADFLTDWLHNFAKPKVRPRTFISYEEIVRLHIIPEIGRLRVKQLESEHVEALMARKLESGLSPRRVEMIRAVLRRALNIALRRNLVVRNVAALAESLRQECRELQIWDEGQAARFLLGAKADPNVLLYETALHTGMRQGELLGVQWNDVDLDQRKLSVNRSLQRVTGQGLVALPLKTERSKRTIRISNSVATKLREHRTDQLEAQLRAGSSWRNTGYIFTTPTGTPLDGRNVTRRFQRLAAKLMLPSARFHDLRHMSASFLLAHGVSVVLVARRLGHTNASTTLRFYAHATDEEDQAAAKILDAAVSG